MTLPIGVGSCMAPPNTSASLKTFRCSLVVSARPVRGSQIPSYGAAPFHRQTPAPQVCEHELEKDHDMETIL